MHGVENGRIGVIGGGLGGLAAACTLAARGYEVILFEKNHWLGGKAAVHEQQGFRFDMGPTILTLPMVLARLFAEAERDMADYLDLIPLDPQWRCFYEDGSTLDLWADTEQMASSLDAFSPGSGAGAGYRRFMALSQRLHDISKRFFFWRSVGSMRDTLDVRSTFSLAVLGDLLHLRLGQSVASTVRAHAADPRVAQLLEHFTQYVGSAPDASPAVLCGIAQMQTHGGIWYPRGGTGAIPRALVQLAGDLHVDLRTDADIVRIRTTQGAVSGVETATGECIALDAVVSNMDAVRTYRDLLGGEAAQRFARQRRYEPACSGVVLYLGLSQAYPHLRHHNFVFSQDPEAEFHTIYRQGEPAPDPTCYVCAPAQTDASVAPPGGEALYILVHTPYVRDHHDWQQMLPAYRRTILDKLARTAGLEDLERRIVYEHALTPADMHQRYRVLHGAIYGLASHGRFTGAFKPGNRRTDVPGLYLAGGAAHPGPGMPMVLMSGWIAADSLDQDDLITSGRHEKGTQAWTMARS
jgi:phytoene desaturase